MGTWMGRGLTGTCDLIEHCSERTAEPYPPRALGVCGVMKRRMARGEREGSCGALIATVAVVVRFEGRYGAVAGLVHAFDSWQRCV